MSGQIDPNDDRYASLAGRILARHNAGEPEANITSAVRDFFAWPTEVGGGPPIRALARRIARFDWQSAPPDIASILYETVIPPDERTLANCQRVVGTAQVGRQQAQPGRVDRLHAQAILAA